MSSRDAIISRVKQNQPPPSPLPQLTNYDQHYEDLLQQYISILRFIGGEAHIVNSYEQVANILRGSFQEATRIISTVELTGLAAEIRPDIGDPHELENVELFITTSNLAVAENGSVWLRDEQLLARALPFISQQLAVILPKESIVATMHDAYDVIGQARYGYAAFVAGPSKTADIEQSLVLGAHGPKSFTAFILV
ncbi:lactate utilization protein B/C [Segetibacter sp. 3557_3]|uniref:LutC/YkgG family protein n=1 Tax=Segetibacter sp. 3557_3 TaxID=2547429 RepID=UPI0010587200|nr:LUD domain-containing protein [Segetibacter sp. 3557_3]TDH27294.1 lactate utilization protein B/C [Segetibacter sp. 3557_3]